MLRKMEVVEVENVVGGEVFGIGTATRENGSKFIYRPDYGNSGSMITYEYGGGFGAKIGGTAGIGVKDSKITVNLEEQSISTPRIDLSNGAVRTNTDVAKELWRIGEHRDY